MVNQKPNITVCGSGSGGLAIAADLAMAECRVNLYEIPAFKANLKPIREAGGIKLSGLPFYGKTGLARVNLITDDPATWPEDCATIYDLEGNNLYELHGGPSDRHAEKWNQIEEIERLLVEDICYSFIPMEQLAGAAELSTPVTTAMTDLSAALTGYDYRAEGLTLEKLVLAGLTIDQIIAYADKGSISS